MAPTVEGKSAHPGSDTVEVPAATQQQGLFEARLPMAVAAHGRSEDRLEMRQHRSTASASDPCGQQHGAWHVAAREVKGGIRFEATSDVHFITVSIHAMVPAHAAITKGAQNCRFQTEEIPSGEALTVTGSDPVRIKAWVGASQDGVRCRASTTR